MGQPKQSHAKKNHAHLSDSSGSAIERFAAGIQRMSEIMRKLGNYNGIASSEDFRYYRALPEEEKWRVIEMLEATLAACEEMMASGLNPKNGGALAWRVMSKLGYQPLSDAFESYTGDDDLVEVYNSRQKLVFASLNLFEHSNYTLEDLYCRPWIELWERDDAITEKLYEKAILVSSPGFKKTISLSDIPTHEIHERYTTNKLHALIASRIFSPVVDRYGENGFLCINHVEKHWTEAAGAETIAVIRT